MDVASNVLFLEVPSFFVSKRGMPESVVIERAIMCLSRTRPKKRGRKLVHGNSSWTVVTNYLPIDCMKRVTKRANVRGAFPVVLTDLTWNAVVSAPALRARSIVEKFEPNRNCRRSASSAPVVQSCNENRQPGVC